MHERRVLECDNASEGHAEAQGKQLLSLRQRSAEAVEHRFDPPAVGAQDMEGIFPRVTLVDDHTEPVFLRKIQLHAEKAGLTEPVCFPGSFRLGLFWRLRSTVIVHPGLSNGHHLWVLQQAAQRGTDVFRRFIHITRVDPQGRENLGVRLRQCH